MAPILRLARMWLLGALAIVPSGCATSLQAGAQTAARTDGPVSQEGKLAAGAGMGDGATGAVLLMARGTFGADLRAGRALGSAAGGFEWLRYGGDFESVASAIHIGVFFGSTLGAADRDAIPLLFLEGGYAWVLDRSTSSARMTALSLSVLIGATLRPEDRGDALFLGVGLTLRSDSFSEWRWHM